jgi:hypothetical protein
MSKDEKRKPVNVYDDMYCPAFEDELAYDQKDKEFDD